MGSKLEGVQGKVQEAKEGHAEAGELGGAASGRTRTCGRIRSDAGENAG